jgi:adenylate cyclase
MPQAHLRGNPRIKAPIPQPLLCPRTGNTVFHKFASTSEHEIITVGESCERVDRQKTSKTGYPLKIVNSATRAKAQFMSGMVLAAFILGHFSNHALGLVSVEAMEAMRGQFNVVWRSWPGTVFLYGALFAHFGLALDALNRRRSLRMPASEAVKIATGIGLPFLILGHVVNTRVDFALSGYDKGYPEVLRALWSSTSGTIMQSIALAVAWAHGCLGIWFWLRGRSWYQRAAPLFHMLAIIIPVLALFGFYSAARTVEAVYLTHSRPLSAALDPELLAGIRLALYTGMLTLVGGTLLLKVIPRPGRISIRYPSGQTVSVIPGVSILEASRSAGIPHVSICGGRGRCSTCRVEIVHGVANRPEPDERERATLKSIRAPENVRLACQFRPHHDIAVLPLVEADGLAPMTRPAQNTASGHERLVAALFCDLRGFTQLTEQKLPYDIVFLLNRYFTVVGEAVESSGGTIDKFIGDGAVALFGLETSFQQACQQALTAAVRLAKGIEALDRSFGIELGSPLKIAIGLHAGPAIIGKIGFGKATTLTAIGDTMNAASRLEGLAKEHNVELAVSADLVREAGYSFDGHERRELTIRGRAATLETWIIPRAAEIERALDASQ